MSSDLLTSLHEGEVSALTNWTLLLPVDAMNSQRLVLYVTRNHFLDLRLRFFAHNLVRLQDNK